MNSKERTAAIRDERVCGNCHALLQEGDRYCRICGTKRGEGAYLPYEDLAQPCIYGSEPVEVTHKCARCGYSWTTCLMIDEQRFCPLCGGPVSSESVMDDLYSDQL